MVLIKKNMKIQIPFSRDVEMPHSHSPPPCTYKERPTPHPSTNIWERDGRSNGRRSHRRGGGRWTGGTCLGGIRGETEVRKMNTKEPQRPERDPDRGHGYQSWAVTKCCPQTAMIGHSVHWRSWERDLRSVKLICKKQITKTNK